MAFLDSLVARLGGRLTREERGLYDRLCRNRLAVAARVPADLRRTFLGACFPRRQLKNIVRFTFREEAVRANPAGYFEDCLAARFGARDFGMDLLRRRINSDDILALLLEGCDVSAAGPR